MKTLSFFSLPLLLTCATALAKPLPPGRAAADSLCKLGASLLEAGKLAEAEGLFRSAAQKDPKYALPHVRLGACYLRRDSLDAALKAFDTALTKDRKSVEALNGLGLVYARQPRQALRAIDHFHQAVVIDKGYVEGWYNLAMTHLRMRNRDALSAFEDVLKADPRHPDAFFRIGTLHEEREDYAKAARAYEGQLAVHPKHEEARYRLGKTYRLLGENAKALEALSEVGGAFARGAVLEMAQVYRQQGQFGNAQAAFEGYIASLDEKERKLYRDLTRVLSGDALESYRALPADRREATLDRFWARRDPAPITDANERLVEHYRRVAHAREHFSEEASPWDARGDVYVRYGAPDHVSRFNDIRFEMDPGVVAVKERLMAQAGEHLAAILPRQEAEATGDRPSRPQVETVDPRGRPVFPVRPGVAWEYWVYARVAGGIEVVFTKDHTGKPYELASLPPEMIGLGSGARWLEMQPVRVVEQASARAPEAYRPDFAAGPLDFYAYAASFRGEAGKSRLEIYTGVPASSLAYAPVGRDSIATVERGVALYDTAGAEVHRHSDAVSLRRPAPGAEGSILPGVMAMDVPPGRYDMALQVRDPRSNRTQVYRRAVEVEAYGEAPLLLSDLEVGVAPPSGRAPEAFTKRGVSVVPMASRAFRKGQPIVVYYEIYNLTLPGGMSAYRVEYTVRSPERKGVGAKILSGMGKLLGVTKKESEVAIAYDLSGTKASEVGYLELNLDESETGPQELTATVTDAHTGRTATRVIQFSVDMR